MEKFLRNPIVVESILDEQVCLFHLDSCQYLVLSRTGAAIWNQIESEKSLEHIVANLLDHYDVDVEICLQDVREWLTTARALDLVQLITSEASGSA